MSSIVVVEQVTEKSIFNKMEVSTPETESSLSSTIGKLNNVESDSSTSSAISSLSSQTQNCTITSNEPKSNEKRDIEPFQRCILEDYVPLSQSHLWKLMMSFYDKQGVQSWAQGIVPYFITSNVFIANKYAEVLQAFFDDCNRAGTVNLDTSEPFYIIELGAGSGKFSFYMLKALEEMKNTLTFPFSRIKYIMTDFTQENINFWKTHEGLKPYVEQGVLDFAKFNAVTDTTLELTYSNIVLNTGAPTKNPIFLVGNYIFDTLCHDLFRVESSYLKEGLVSVGSSQEHEVDPLDPNIIKRLSNKYKYENIDATSYYPRNEKEKDDFDNEMLNGILQWYKNNYALEDATILLPVGALRAIYHLGKMSNGRIIILSGDKGNNNPNNFKGLYDPHIAVHGSFSVMVNYHAIGLYFSLKGGLVLHSPQEEASLKISLFLSDAKAVPNSDASSSSFPRLTRAFENNIVSFGPNDFFMMQKGLKEDTRDTGIRTVLSMLKLSYWDPDIFYKFRDIILAQTATCGSKLKNDIVLGIPIMWKNYYALDKDKDIAFEIGRFFYGIKDHKNALKFYQVSLDSMGAHHVTYHNIGLCYYSEGKLEMSLDFFDKARRLNSLYEKAKKWYEKVENEIQAKKETKIFPETLVDLTNHKTEAETIKGKSDIFQEKEKNLGII